MYEFVYLFEKLICPTMPYIDISGSEQKREFQQIDEYPCLAVSNREEG